MKNDEEPPSSGRQKRSGDKGQNRFLVELEEEDFLYKIEDRLAGVRTELVALAHKATPNLEQTVENAVIMADIVATYRLQELRVQLANVIERRFAELEERIERRSDRGLDSDEPE